ncbi:unnamed protein product [Caenorhabditis angaria]|uniref:Uncharacterized protein n=1 Tax=Caenorhabditis angaria TaxID=860376 RepID=A0A9P1IYC5_9PELO|nr:unnamed protein product [Caenorhabditis angaria]
MGVCISQESTCVNVHNIETNNDLVNYSKAEERPPMTVEHQTYDYKQAEEEQSDEFHAIICCPHSIGYQPDKLALIDLDPTSETYCQIISELTFTSNRDEPGRMNWAKSAEYFSEMSNIKRSHLIVPCMNTNKIYIVLFDRENLKLRLEKEIKGDVLLKKDISCPYAVHSLPLKGAPVHISTLGDKHGHGKGDYILLDRRTWELRQKSEPTFANFGGEFSLQPRHNILISCEWGQPRLFRNGFTTDDLENVTESFGSSLHIWQISPPKMLQTLTLNPYDGCLISTVRFMHNSDCNHAFACSAIGGTIFHIHMNTLTQIWTADKVASIPSLKVDDWQSSEMPALLTDMVLSMDDRWMYICGFLHGVVWKFDIQDPFRVSLFGKINLGGIMESFPEVSIRKGNAMENRWWLPPEVRSYPRGVRYRGGPAIMQLSKDGNRLYISNSFYKAWDAQFYPELISDGGQMVRVDMLENDEMKLNENFLIDMKDQTNNKNGSFVIRDIRLVDGDCTNILLTFGIQPVFLFPIIGGFCNGFLSKVFNLSSLFLSGFMMSSVASQNKALNMCFIRRHQAISKISRTQQIHKHCYKLIIVVFIIYPFSLFSFFYYIGSSKNEQLDYISIKYPEYLHDFLNLREFFVGIPNAKIFAFFVIILSSEAMAVNISIYTTIQMFRLLREYRHCLSNDNYNKHRNAIKSLLAQLCVSFMTGLPPIEITVNYFSNFSTKCSTIFAY